MQFEVVDISRKKIDGSWSPYLSLCDHNSLELQTLNLQDVQSIFMESPKKKQVMMSCHEWESGSAGLS